MDETELRRLLVEVAKISERLRALDSKDSDKFRTMETRLDQLERQQRELVAQMQRRHGGTAVMLAVGGLAGWLITQWDHMTAFFRGNGQ